MAQATGNDLNVGSSGKWRQIGARSLLVAVDDARARSRSQRAGDDGREVDVVRGGRGAGTIKWRENKNKIQEKGLAAVEDLDSDAVIGKGSNGL